jgi:hypothetical protein
MKISDALALAPTPGCRIKPTVLRGFSGCASPARQHRMRLMAAALALMRSSVIGPTPSLIDRSGQDWDARDFCHIRYGAVWREARRPPRYQATCPAPSQNAGADGIIVAALLKVLRARLVLAISPSWRKVPCRKMRRQRTKSPQELHSGACSRVSSRE